jgi:hypothetical protein
MVRLNDPVCMMYLHVLPSTVGNVLPYIYIIFITIITFLPKHIIMLSSKRLTPNFWVQFVAPLASRLRRRTPLRPPRCRVNFTRDIPSCSPCSYVAWWLWHLKMSGKSTSLYSGFISISISIYVGAYIWYIYYSMFLCGQISMRGLIYGWMVYLGWDLHGFTCGLFTRELENFRWWWPVI